MTEKIINKDRKAGMSLFDYATEIMGWLQIMSAPLLTGIIIGALVYFSQPSGTRLLIAIGIALTGLITGIIYATRIWKKQGTIHFVSRVSATPELDEVEEEIK